MTGEQRPSDTVVHTVRLRSYLSPGLPEGLFYDIGSVISEATERRVIVDFVTDSSGPAIGVGDPLAGIDLAFVCGPSLVELRRMGAARLVGVAPVFDDVRNGGRPVYHSDVVVRSDHPARSLDDLVAAAWAVNDPRSLSGYGCVVKALGESVARVWSGGHLRSLELVRDGAADAAAIDANVLRRIDTAGLRVVHTFGPHPVQPVVAHPSFGLAVDVADALRSAAFPQWGVIGFSAVADEDYPDSLD